MTLGTPFPGVPAGNDPCIECLRRSIQQGVGNFGSKILGCSVMQRAGLQIANYFWRFSTYVLTTTPQRHRQTDV